MIAYPVLGFSGAGTLQVMPPGKLALIPGFVRLEPTFACALFSAKTNHFCRCLNAN